jgi:hypothetical protein
MILRLLPKQALIRLIQDDIMGSIKKNLEVSDMTDESFMTEVDILCEEKERLQLQIDERDVVIAEKDSALAKKDSALAKKDSALAQKDLEIEALKKQLAALQNREH